MTQIKIQAQCIHIPDGSVVIWGALFDHFSDWARTEKVFLEEIEKLQGELGAAEQHIKILTAARDACEGTARMAEDAAKKSGDGQ